MALKLPTLTLRPEAEEENMNDNIMNFIEENYVHML